MNINIQPAPIKEIPMNIINPRRVGNLWLFPDGRTLPVVAGGDHSAAPTLTSALEDDKAKILDQIDDILDTAKSAGRELTDQERVDHDALVAQIEGPDGLDARISAAKRKAGDEDRYERQGARKVSFPVPNINVRGGQSVGADVTRDLNGLLWATDETVRAGHYDKTGTWRNDAYGAVNPVDPVTVRFDDGNASPAPRISEFQPQDRQAIRTFQNTVTDMILFGFLVDKDVRSSKNAFETARSHRAFKDRWQRMMNALDVDTAAEGTEWVPTGIGATLHEKVRAAGKIAPLFSRIDLPTNPWKWPLEGADATAYRVAEPTSDSATKVTASTPGTGAPTFDAEIMGGRVLFSRSLEADSALAILPFVRAKLVQAFVDAEEKAILDGDSDGTHQDSDTQAVGATHFSSAWDGLRKKAIAQTIVTATTTSVANLLLLRGGMGKWGVNPADLAYIVGVSALHDLIGDTNLLTVDKMGPQATILSGMVGSIGGVPVIVSEHVRENLNATGVYDGITTTKTYNLCVNRNEWAIGQRMAMDLEVDDSIYRETYQRVVVAFMREDFQSIADAATNEDTAISYNVTP